MTSSPPLLGRQVRRRTDERDTATSSVDLPRELIQLILSRFPIESFARFKSVSKSWQSAIFDPCFSRSYRIQRSKLPENQNKFFLWEGRWLLPGRRHYGLHLMRLEDEKFRIKSESWLGYPCSGKLLEPLCSCDGLIVLRVDRMEYMLWNPLIRGHVIIPAFQNWPLTDIKAHHCHLYRDSITDDYKIVFFNYWKSYAVYSCNNGSWGEVKHFPWDRNLYEIIPREGEAVVDGCLYRLCYPGIICVDARDGKLHKFPQPVGVEFLVKVHLKVVSGKLCLYGVSDSSEEGFQLWVMEENGSFDKCWRKLISMEKEPLIWNIRPVYLTSKDEVVLWARVPKTEYGHKHFVYNPRGNCKFKEINFISKEDAVLWDDDCHKYFPYSENPYMLSNIC